MGIPYFFYTIYKKYCDERGLVLQEADVSNMKNDYLFFDYNSMIHPCAQRILSHLDEEYDKPILDELIINEVISYTRYVINLVKPKTTYIVIDGVAPRAKVNQQRERRYKSLILKDLSHKECVWDTNQITPGTPFMEKLSKNLRVFINDSCHHIVLSDASERGEGEHKMMQMIKHLNGRVCIYGLDADLIMLSLMNKKADDIVLLRDNTFNEKLTESKKTYTFLDIKTLKTCICNEIRMRYEKIKLSKLTNFTNQSIIIDYIFLCFLLGNDFLDHIPNMVIKDNGVNVILKIYVNLISSFNKPLVNISNSLGDYIDKDMINELFKQISNLESYYFSNVFKPAMYKDTFTEADWSGCKSAKVFNRDIIMFQREGFKSRYYTYYGISNVNQACSDYIKTLYWVLGYYDMHSHDNWSWYYNHRACPFASDIYNFLISSKSKFNLSDLSPSPSLSSTQQLLLVLPKQSLSNLTCINKEISKVMTLLNCNSDYITKLYPENVCLDLINKEYVWQAKVFLEDIGTDFFTNICLN